MPVTVMLPAFDLADISRDIEATEARILEDLRRREQPQADATLLQLSQALASEAFFGTLQQEAERRAQHLESRKQANGSCTYERYERHMSLLQDAVQGLQSLAKDEQQRHLDSLRDQFSDALLHQLSSVLVPLYAREVAALFTGAAGQPAAAEAGSEERRQLREAVSTLQAQLEEAREALEEARAHTVEASHVAALQAELEQKGWEMAELETAQPQLEEMRQQMSEQREQSEREAQALRQQVERLQEEAGRERERLEAEVKTMQEDNLALAGDLEDSQLELDSLHRRLLQAEEQLQQGAEQGTGDAGDAEGRWRDGATGSGGADADATGFAGGSRSGPAEQCDAAVQCDVPEAEPEAEAGGEQLNRGSSLRYLMAANVMLTQFRSQARLQLHNLGLHASRAQSLAANFQMRSLSLTPGSSPVPQLPAPAPGGPGASASLTPALMELKPSRLPVLTPLGASGGGGGALDAQPEAEAAGDAGEDAAMERLLADVRNHRRNAELLLRSSRHRGASPSVSEDSLRAAAAGRGAGSSAAGSENDPCLGNLVREQAASPVDSLQRLLESLDDASPGISSTADSSSVVASRLLHRGSKAALHAAAEAGACAELEATAAEGELAVLKASIQDWEAMLRVLKEEWVGTSQRAANSALELEGLQLALADGREQQQQAQSRLAQLQQQEQQLSQTLAHTQRQLAETERQLQAKQELLFQLQAEAEAGEQLEFLQRSQEAGAHWPSSRVGHTTLTVRVGATGAPHAPGCEDGAGGGEGGYLSQPFAAEAAGAGLDRGVPPLQRTRSPTLRNHSPCEPASNAGSFHLASETGSRGSQELRRGPAAFPMQGTEAGPEAVWESPRAKRPRSQPGSPHGHHGVSSPAFASCRSGEGGAALSVASATAAPPPEQPAGGASGEVPEGPVGGVQDASAEPAQVATLQLQLQEAHDLLEQERLRTAEKEREVAEARAAARAAAAAAAAGPQAAEGAGLGRWEDLIEDAAGQLERIERQVEACAQRLVETQQQVAELTEQRVAAAVALAAAEAAAEAAEAKLQGNRAQLQEAESMLAAQRVESRALEGALEEAAQKLQRTERLLQEKGSEFQQVNEEVLQLLEEKRKQELAVIDLQRDSEAAAGSCRQVEEQLQQLRQSLQQERDRRLEEGEQMEELQKQAEAAAAELQALHSEVAAARQQRDAALADWLDRQAVPVTSAAGEGSGPTKRDPLDTEAADSSSAEDASPGLQHSAPPQQLVELEDKAVQADISGPGEPAVQQDSEEGRRQGAASESDHAPPDAASVPRAGAQQQAMPGQADSQLAAAAPQATAGAPEAAGSSGPEHCGTELQNSGVAAETALAEKLQELQVQLKAAEARAGLAVHVRRPAASPGAPALPGSRQDTLHPQAQGSAVWELQLEQARHAASLQKQKVALLEAACQDLEQQLRAEREAALKLRLQHLDAPTPWGACASAPLTPPPPAAEVAAGQQRDADTGLAKLEVARHALRAEEQQLRGTCAELQQQAEAARAELRATMQQQLQVASEVQAAQRQLQAQRLEAELAGAEASGMREQLQRLRTEAAEAQQRRKGSESGAAEALPEVFEQAVTLRAMLGQLEVECAEADARLGRLRREAAAAEFRKDTMEQELARLSARGEAEQPDCAEEAGLLQGAARAEESRLQAAVAALRMEAEQLQLEAEAARTDVKQQRALAQEQRRVEEQQQRAVQDRLRRLQQRCRDAEAQVAAVAQKDGPAARRAGGLGAPQEGALAGCQGAPAAAAGQVSTTAPPTPCSPAAGRSPPGSSAVGGAGARRQPQEKLREAREETRRLQEQLHDCDLQLIRLRAQLDSGEAARELLEQQLQRERGQARQQAAAAARSACSSAAANGARADLERVRQQLAEAREAFRQQLQANKQLHEEAAQCRGQLQQTEQELQAAQQEVTAQRQAARAVQAEVASLQAQLERLQRQCRDARAQLVQLQSSSRVACSQPDVAAPTVLASESARRLEAAESALAALQAAEQAESRERQQLQRMVQELEAALEDAGGRADAESAARRTAERQAAAAAAEADALRSQQTQLEEALATAEESGQKVERDWQVACTAAEEEVKQLQRELAEQAALASNEAAAAAAHLQQQVASSSAALQAERERSSEQAQRAREEVAAALQRQAAAFVAEREGCGAQQSRLQQQVDSLQQQLASLQQRHSTAQAAAEEQLAAAQAQLQASDEELPRAQAARATSEAELAAAQAQLKELGGELRQAQAVRTTSEAELAVAQVQLKALDGDLRQAQGARAASEEELAAAQAQLQALDEELRRAEATRAVSEADLRRAEAQLQALDEELRRAQAARAASEAELAAAQVQLQASEEERQRAQAARAASVAELAAAQVQLKDARSEQAEAEAGLRRVAEQVRMLCAAVGGEARTAATRPPGGGKRAKLQDGGLEPAAAAMAHAEAAIAAVIPEMGRLQREATAAAALRQEVLAERQRSQDALDRMQQLQDKRLRQPLEWQDAEALCYSSSPQPHARRPARLQPSGLVLSLGAAAAQQPRPQPPPEAGAASAVQQLQLLHARAAAVCATAGVAFPAPPPASPVKRPRSGDAAAAAAACARDSSGAAAAPQQLARGVAGALQALADALEQATGAFVDSWTASPRASPTPSNPHSQADAACQCSEAAVVPAAPALPGALVEELAAARGTLAELQRGWDAAKAGLAEELLRLAQDRRRAEAAVLRLRRQVQEMGQEMQMARQLSAAISSLWRAANLRPQHRPHPAQAPPQPLPCAGKLAEAGGKLERGDLVRRAVRAIQLVDAHIQSRSAALPSQQSERPARASAPAAQRRRRAQPPAVPCSAAEGLRTGGSEDVASSPSSVGSGTVAELEQRWALAQQRCAAAIAGSSGCDGSPDSGGHQPSRPSGGGVVICDAPAAVQATLDSLRKEVARTVQESAQLRSVVVGVEEAVPPILLQLQAAADRLSAAGTSARSQPELTSLTPRPRTVPVACAVEEAVQKLTLAQGLLAALRQCCRSALRLHSAPAPAQAADSALRISSGKQLRRTKRLELLHRVKLARQQQLLLEEEGERHAAGLAASCTAAAATRQH